jgi:hypothetical protein
MQNLNSLKHHKEQKKDRKNSKKRQEGQKAQNAHRREDTYTLIKRKQNFPHILRNSDRIAL